MTQVNLLPSDVKQRARTRQVTVLVGVVVGVIVAGLIGLFMLESGKLASAQSDLAAANAQNAALTQKVSSLQRFQTLADEQQAKKQTVNELKSGTVSFSGVLVDLSRAIPSSAYLTSVTGTLQATVASRGSVSGSGSTTPNIVGNIQWQGNATDHDAVALWLDRLVQVTGWNNSWITGSTEQGGTKWVQFTGSVDLGQKVTSGGK
jgi:Tfp pilus assembly protein PilN